MAADKFRRVFGRVKYSWILGLTATLERLDEKHDVVETYAPVCDMITQKEAITRGWITDFIEFNLAVPITREEAEMQVSLGKQIRYYMSRFGDFYTMLGCMDRGNATRYAHANNEDVNEVVKNATQGIRLIHKRKEFLDTTEHKIAAAVELIEEFDVRTITFSQATAFADEVSKRLGKKCRPYHSSLSSEMRMVTKTKEYKTMVGAKKWQLKLAEEGHEARIKSRKNDHVVTWKVPKSFSGSKVAESNALLFEEGKLQILASAKALDQGFDVPDVMLGVDGSRSENPTQHTQRTGRIARNYKLPNGELATKVYVNLYIPDWSVANSRDEQKLRRCQKKNSENVVWVDDLDELKEMLNAILKKRGEDSNQSAVNAVVEGTDSYID
jgi:superfamily II DNA or RNA helicase